MKNLSFLSESINNPLLKELSYIKIGGTANYLIKPESIEKLQKDIIFLTNNNIKYFVVGNGSNTLFPDGNFEGVIIQLGNRFQGIKEIDNKLVVGAGVLLPQLLNYCSKNGYSGFEKCIGIPGTIGGAVFSNAGAFKWSISENVSFVTIYENNSLRKFEKDEIKFAYRKSNINGIITEAGFTYEKVDQSLIESKIDKFRNVRFNTQPTSKNSLGSIFKNPTDNYAGKLIELCDLKGHRIGDAEISRKHANFIINKANAKQKDVLALIDLVQEKVMNKFQIKLETEINIIK